MHREPRAYRLTAWRLIAAITICTAVCGCTTIPPQGVALFESQEYESAVPYFLTAINENPGNWYPPNRLGWCYFYLGRHEEAIAQFKISNDLEEKWGTHEGLSRSLYATGDYEQAAKHASRWSDMQPQAWAPHNHLGWCYFRLQRYEDAITQFKISNTIEETWGSYNGLGLAHRALGQLDQAVQAFKRALQTADDEYHKWQIKLSLADCHVARGDYKGAHEILGDRASLGVRISSLPKGMRVESVYEGWPADIAGIRSGDLITSFAGKTLAGVTVGDFVGKIIASTAFGSTVKVEVERDGKPLHVNLPVGLTSAPGEDSPSHSRSIALPLLSSPPANIAVSNLDPIELPIGEVLTLSENLRSSLVNTRYFIVASRADMKRILAEADFQNTDRCSDTQCLVEMGRILAVRKIVGGTVGKVGHTYNIVVRMVDVETSKIDYSITEDVKAEVDDLLPAIRNIARKLALKYGESRTKE